MPESLEDFILTTPAKIPYVIEAGILTEGGRLIVYGTRKNFKSQMGRHCLFCVVLGTPFFGYQTVSKRVLLIDLETPSREELQMLLSTYIRGHGITVPPKK